MAVTDCSVPLASVSVSDGDASPETLVVSVDRKFWAALEIWASAFCVDVSRAETSAFESTMPFMRSRSRSKDTDWPVRDPSARPMSAKRPVETSFCALVSSLCARISE